MYLPNRLIWLTFTDTDNHWANLCLEGVGTEGLMRGYPNSSFQPNGTMTRAEFAAVMIQAFPDVPKERSINYCRILKIDW